jgi:hypothetical protein
VRDDGRAEDIGRRRNEERDGGLEVRLGNNWQWALTFRAVAGPYE